MADPIDIVLDALAESGLLDDACRTDDGAVEGEICVEGIRSTLRVAPGPRSGSKPIVSIPSETSLGRIPHVEQNGTVCYQSNEGLVFDRRDPGFVAVEAARLASNVLADGVSGRNHTDFAEEWETYWSPLGGLRLALTVNLPSTLCSLVTMERAERKRKKRSHPDWIDGYVGYSERDVTAFFNSKRYDERHTTRKAIYLPLAPGSVLTPPTADCLWTPTEARNIVRGHLTPDVLARLDKTLRKHRPRNIETVFVALPRPTGGHAVFGLRFSGVRDAHPLDPQGQASTVRPIQVERWDPEYLVPRGGGFASLATCHVIVAGCGAVGGHLVFELARAGVGRITLVDPDLLSPDNTFRHVLGREFWGHTKSSALKTALERHFPFLRVETITSHLESALDDGQLDLAEADLLAVAIGAPTIELNINERLWSMPDPPATLFSWLEPLGLGGHALLTRPNHGPGCYECLHTSDNDPLDNRAAFAAPDQDFSRATAGCGSLHTPYASSDALRTAALAAHLAADALSDQELGAPIQSWKGDPTAFHAAGFRTTGRFSLSAEELHAQRYDYHAPTCVVCATPTPLADD